MTIGTAIVAISRRTLARSTKAMTIAKRLRSMARWHQCQHVAPGGTC
jgi:hypothetical protein